MSDVKYTISLEDKFSNKIKGLDNDVSHFESKILSAGKAIGSIFAVGAISSGITSLGKKIVRLGSALEQTEISFGTMLGSARKGKELIETLQQFAVVTPFTSSQVQEFSKRLMAMGIEAEKIIPNMRMLGDISSGVGMDKLPNLVLAFGQVKAATRLTGMELRQFTEAGVPLLDELAKQTGKSVSYIKETMISKGQVSFEMVEKALAGMTGAGGRFFNLMKKQSKSAGGLWSTFVDKMELAGAYMGKRLLPTVKHTEIGLIRFADKLLSITKIPVSQALGKEKNEINTLIRSILSLNEKNTDRKKLISELIGQYPDLLKNIKAEGITTDILRKTLIKVNDEYEKKQLLALGEESEEKIQKKINDNEEERLNFLKRINEAYYDIYKTDDENLSLAQKIAKVESQQYRFITQEKEQTAKSILVLYEEYNKTINRGKFLQNDLGRATIRRIKAETALLRKGYKLGDKDLTGKIKGSLDSETEDMLSKITAQSPKIFNINIEKLVETINNNVTNLKEGMSATKNIVSEALIDSLNQTQIIATQ